MADQDLAFISATEAIAKFRAKSLSPVELLDAVIARHDAANSKINAFTRTSFEQARAQAKKAEANYAAGKPTRAFEGVPLVIKDEFAIKGQVTTHGSLLYKDHVDEETEYFVERMMRARPTVIGRSTCPEFSSACVTNSRLWGVTRNPWNTRFNSGGSTGGGAAAVAAGMTVLSDGSDYAGSVRIPASACGVFGFKPPFGRIPTSPPWYLNPYAVIGPVTRTVADAALMMNVMAGHDPRDLTSVREKLRYPSQYKPIKGWRVAYSADLGFYPVAPDVAKATRAALDAFREAGAEIEEVDLGWTDDAVRGFIAHVRENEFAPFDKLPAKQRALLCDYIRNRKGKFLAKGTSYAQSLTIRAAMYAKLEPILERCQILLSPTLAVPSVPAEHDPLDDSFTINGKKVEPQIGWCMTFPFNMLPQLPVATVPCGFGKSGVPVGLQIVGRPFDDLTVFQAAAAFEQARPWRQHRPKI
ncbi:amidase [Hypericibacter sp.]|uniref:amidase n=1 Tax=Hypericibacter sp. TaxID=2705401 RepID=UPI003D6C8170